MSLLAGRRQFTQSLARTLALLGVGGQALLRSGSVRAAVLEAQESGAMRAPWPKMQYRSLGRTGFSGSRLIFGCGATLMSSRRDELLHAAFDAGVNVFDVGTGRYYDNAERNLAAFLKTHRDRVFLISKAMVYLDVEPEESITLAQAKQAAQTWIGLLEQSLRDMQTEHIDAYYLMGSNNTSVVTNEEIYSAFQRAKAAGKVSHLGLSTHQNAQAVLEAAIETAWYDLAMIAITPGGWYNWEDRNILPGSPTLKELQPLLARARDSGIGLIGMKAARFLAGRKFLGWGNPDAFDEYYDEQYLAEKLSAFQRSYAFLLEHGLDAVNADMQNFVHLKENFVAAATSRQYFVA
jgi:hypothetical protein